ELASTFDDIKRLRFRHMLRILSSIDERDVTDIKATFLIRNYYHVYETMVDQLLNGLSDRQRKKYNPSGKWSLLGSHVRDASSLEPDTIVKYNGETYIVDAKMYRFGFTGNPDDLPDSTSIQKQLTYGDHAKKNIGGGKDVRNAFILPFDKLKLPLEDWQCDYLEDDNLLYVGFAEGDWRDSSNPNDHDKIYTYLVDFNYLLNNYGGSDNSIINELCKDIEKRITK
ncbi:MAG: LlaJI family restriction endonuclease, partial [Firmicutes bacterium]|nr:LlaJI family restriction endonuclease [Bacillota bacterium]